ncbi:MAG: hypothetical protein V4550_06895 [Gemmatimonadota bacterium]
MDTTLASGFITPTGPSMTLKTTNGGESTATIDGSWLTHVTALHTMRYWKYSACTVANGTYTPC